MSHFDDVMSPNLSLIRVAALEGDRELRDWLGNTREAKQLLDEVGMKVTDWIE